MIQEVWLAVLKITFSYREKGEIRIFVHEKVKNTKNKQFAALDSWSDCIQYKMWDEITYPFPNFNPSTMNNFIHYKVCDKLTYSIPLNGRIPIDTA